MPRDGSSYMPKSQEDKLTELLLALGPVTSSPSSQRLQAHSMRKSVRMQDPETSGEAAGEAGSSDFWSAPGDEEEEGEEVNLLPYLGYFLFLLFVLPLFTTMFGFDSD
eukprot:CAMPEP_0169167552 /NCGR_PEP_ID=MMETSP1015-20121227/60535_1 /TAXON_ID=342587 /ORGANISM="Karlodinium micrum, Strain CCMP2283" /LENGTH=107 /DNA_ID=CAMNT_0009240275 /DNA_START=126 /DNA_END=449 /DNA_ORIENTATION=+